MDHLNPKRQSAWRRVLSPPQLSILGRIAVALQLPFAAYMIYLMVNVHDDAVDLQGLDGDVKDDIREPPTTESKTCTSDLAIGLCHVALWWVNTTLQISLYNGFNGMKQLSRVPLVDLPMNGEWARCDSRVNEPPTNTPNTH